jgi:ABC-type amino acid transport system permease subunit
MISRCKHIGYSLLGMLLTLPLTAAADVGSLENPLSNTNTIQELIVAVVNIFRIIAIPIIVFFIIYAGFLYVTARGNPANIQKATQALMYAVIGGVIIVGAEVIAIIVKNTVESF